VIITIEITNKLSCESSEPSSTLDKVERVERVELCCSTMSTQPKCMGSTRRTCRVESSRVESSRAKWNLGLTRHSKAQIPPGPSRNVTSQHDLSRAKMHSVSCRVTWNLSFRWGRSTIRVFLTTAV